ncbi:proline racemase family protein [Draconibacterium sp.]|nr:proline racemase family protein [Draconibacterium sp.]
MSKNPINKFNWKPPNNWLNIETIDLHTGGEPLRVITNGLPEVKGITILEKRRFFRDNLDFLRTGLMWEPRGHADMYGAVVTEPMSEGSDFGTFFMHNEGYSTMCGHAIIALVKLMHDTGSLVKENNEYIIDAPPGLIRAKAEIKDGKVTRTYFRNVPSFVLMADQKVDVSGIGEVKFDIAFGGAFYAFVDADSIRLGLNDKDYNQLIDWGKKIKKAIIGKFEIKHPFEEDLSFLYGTVFIGKAKNTNHHSRNVCIFAEGEVDRSPTGSGVSARAAIHSLKDNLKVGEEITIESILDTTMTVKVVEETTYGPHKAVIPEVSGTAHITGQNSFCFDPKDELKNGFIFR